MFKVRTRKSGSNKGLQIMNFFLIEVSVHQVSSNFDRKAKKNRDQKIQDSCWNISKRVRWKLNKMCPENSRRGKLSWSAWVPGGDASLEPFQDACKYKQMMQSSSGFAGKFQKGAPVAAGDRAVERGWGGNFYRGPGLKGDHESEINLILSHISLFLDIKSVKFLQISGFLLKSRGVCDQKRQYKMVGGRPKTLPGPLHSLYGPGRVSR